ncbi:MAG: hypothetical protein NT024_07675, partial [Proteobacteria bacterium]|nr:hypothetical protein [Pseudomonadota bacterium]
MTYRVFQWASGTVGRHAAAAVQLRSDMALVGLHTLTAAKAGRDIGELLGSGNLGIAATNSIDAVMRSDADIVIHAPLPSLVYGDREQQDLDDICTLLAAGKNVITVVGYLYPKAHGADVVNRLAAACAAGGSTFHSTGLNPGWMGDLLPLAMGALSRDIEHDLADPGRPVSHTRMMGRCGGHTSERTGNPIQRLKYNDDCPMADRRFWRPRKQSPRTAARVRPVARAISSSDWPSRYRRRTTSHWSA